jgi:N-acetyl-anhydromuramyl-L-alanine amidase AmpD
MKITDKKYISKKYFPGFPRPKEKISTIVVHHTDGEGTFANLEAWMTGKDALADLYSKGIGLFHFAIDKDGSIYQIMDIDTWCYHSESGTADSFSIGIELIHRTGDFTPQQYESLSWLIKKLNEESPLQFIVSHDYCRRFISGLTRKFCPGDSFDWAKLALMVGANPPNVGAEILYLLAVQNG